MQTILSSHKEELKQKAMKKKYSNNKISKIKKENHNCLNLRMSYNQESIILKIEHLKTEGYISLIRGRVKSASGHKAYKIRDMW